MICLKWLFNLTKLFLIFIIFTSINGEEFTDPSTENASTFKSIDNDPPSPAINNAGPGNDPESFEPSRPTFGKIPLPNLFHNLFTQFLRPMKFSSKTYGPSVIAIIGDKPYISMEVFSKFSPFRWLMNAFQGKIQNVCGFLTSSAQDDPPDNPQNIFQGLMDEKPPVPPKGPKPTSLLHSGQIKIYDTPVGFITSNRRVL